QLEYMNESYGSNLQQVSFQYVPSNKSKAASLSFHLTTNEKKEILNSLHNKVNVDELTKLKNFLVEKED
ncbi:MAG TPA: hypothetical protein PLH33_02045, partial [Chitinophagaceae bacterium]|nr:hypothetical protein [Chitinophagaceae bacterium]